MEDRYQSFAYDYDEFGRIEEYLGAEAAFFNRYSQKINLRVCWIVPVVQANIYICYRKWT